MSGGGGLESRAGRRGKRARAAMRIGVYRIDGFEAVCEACGWYGTPGLLREEANVELKAHRADPSHRARGRAHGRGAADPAPPAGAGSIAGAGGRP